MAVDNVLARGHLAPPSIPISIKKLIAATVEPNIKKHRLRSVVRTCKQKWRKPGQNAAAAVSLPPPPRPRFRDEMEPPLFGALQRASPGCRALMTDRRRTVVLSNANVRAHPSPPLAALVRGSRP